MNPVQAPARRITAILLEAGVVTQEQIETGLERQRETGLRIGETLVEMGAATEEDIGLALARQLGISFVDVQSDAIDRELVLKFPANMLERLEAVPLIHTDDQLSVAMSDPTDVDALAELAKVARCRIEPSAATATAIRRALGDLIGLSNVKPAGPPRRVAGNIIPINWSRSETTFLAFHIEGAIRNGATSLHLLADDEFLHVSRRIDGALVPVTTEPARLLRSLLDRLEALGFPPARLSEPLHRSGRVSIPIGADVVPVDVSILAHDEGTAVTLRFPTPDSTPQTLADLGLDDRTLATVRDALARPAGLVLVTGAITSGVSTILSCLLHAVVECERRAYAFVSAESNRLGTAPGPLRIKLPAGSPPALWEEIVTGQDPDVAVIDDFRAREQAMLAAARAAAAHLIIAGTDWENPFILLEHLGQDSRTRAAVATALFLVIGLRPAAPAGERAAAAPRSRFALDVLPIGQTMREALRRGVHEAGLREIAPAAGLNSSFKS